MERRTFNLAERIAQEEPVVSWTDRIWSIGTIVSEEKRISMRNGLSHLARKAGGIWDTASEYAWAATISFVVMVLPLAIEVDREQQLNDFENGHNASI